MEDSRLLGPILKEWFAQNEWPQSVSEGLARAKGWELGPWASQISICMSGRLTPKPNFFKALGQFNQAVAERDFIGVTDRRLMDRLKRGEPLTRDDGIPWTATDFFAAYIGDVNAPKPPVVQELTQEIVDKWQAMVREAWRELVMTTMLPSARVWTEVREICIAKGISPEELDWVQEVLCGLREATLEEGKRMVTKYDNQPLIRAFMTVQEKHGGDTSKLKKLLGWRQNLPEPSPEDRSFLPAPSVPPRRQMGFDAYASRPFSLQPGIALA